MNGRGPRSVGDSAAEPNAPATAATGAPLMGQTCATGAVDGPPPLGRLRRFSGAAPWIALAALAITLALAYAIKAVCLGGESGFWGETRYCYSDVRILWGFRGFDIDAVPYAPLPADYGSDRTFEYPPGLAFPAWLVAAVTSSSAAFFNLHALTFVGSAFATLWALHYALRALGRSQWRLLGFALSPGLVLFGMQNWDLWPVALSAVGLAAASRGRSRWAGFWFGLGAATKWWPGMLVVTLLAGPWAPRVEPGGPLARLRVRAEPMLIALVAWAVIQLPAVLVSARGWAAAIFFHLRRPANLDSTGAAVAALGDWLKPGAFWGGSFASVVTVVSLCVLVAGLLFVVSRLARGLLDPGDASLAVVALFLLTGKVFSPQFVLWLLPVAVVARVSWRPVLAVELTNAAVWLLYGPWVAHQSDPGFSWLLSAAQAVSVLRSVAVTWLVVVALRSPVATRTLRPASRF